MNGRILIGDVRQTLAGLPANSVHCCVTSPPYWGLRDYGCEGQLGLEPSPDAFVANMVGVFREVRRVLHPSGTLFLNIGDSYASDAKGPRSGDSSTLESGAAYQSEALSGRVQKNWRGGGIKKKDMVGIPWMLAFALRADGWYLRSEIIWHKRSPMPSSVKDRPTTAHESIFVLTKSPRYFWDHVASAEPTTGNAHSRGKGVNPKSHGGLQGREKQNESFAAAVRGLVETRNMRSVWSLSAEPYKGAHFACFPSELVRRCLSAGVSAYGCCPLCLEPWERIVENERVPTRPGDGSKTHKHPANWARGSGIDHSAAAHNTPAKHRKATGNRDPERHVSRKVTTGWRPTCKCGTLEVIPCTVLDPFLGSGTTAQVAQHLGYAWLGCELNGDYIAQAETRIATPPRCLQTKPAAKRMRRIIARIDQQLELLFAEAAP